MSHHHTVSMTNALLEFVFSLYYEFCEASEGAIYIMDCTITDKRVRCKVAEYMLDLKGFKINITTTEYGNDDILSVICKHSAAFNVMSYNAPLQSKIIIDSRDIPEVFRVASSVFDTFKPCMELTYSENFKTIYVAHPRNNDVIYCIKWVKDDL